MSADVRVQLFNAERYRSTVLPAHERWVDGGDLAPLAELLEAARERLPAAGDGLRGPRPLFLSGARIDALASALRDRPAEASRIRDELVPLLVESCIEWGVGLNPDQDVSTTPLVPYLCARSPWLARLLTMMEAPGGERLELSAGASSELFSRHQAGRLLGELRKIPASDEWQIQEDLDNLTRVVSASLDRPGLALLLTVT